VFTADNIALFVVAIAVALAVATLHGQLLELGSHEELVAKGGKYAELFRLQAKGYV
jgi:ABC-type transport system involved in Fe-S cluster assembly fused permease/ATPase subunit